MASVTTNEAFLDLIRKSSIVDSEILDGYSNGAAADPNPLKLARRMVADGVLTEWQAKFFASGRHRIKVGQYILLDRLDINELGDRFIGVHRQLDRKVDICIFPEQLEQNQALFQAFLEKASKVAELDHPNLLHLYDIDKEQNRYFFVSEHEEGMTLEQIPLGSLSNQDIASIVHQCLEGLAYAHQRGIIHGRLNESQIRRSPDGVVKIRNIGLAELMRRLAEAGNSVDEYAIEHQPIDDMITIGVIGRKLVHQHQGHPKNESDRRLVMLLTDLSKFVPGQDQTIDSIKQGILDWRHQSRRPTATAAEKPQAAPSESSSFPPKIALIAGGVVTAIVILIVAGWLLFGGSESDKNNSIADNSENTTDRDKEQSPSNDKNEKTTSTDKGQDKDSGSGVSALSDAINNLNQRSDPEDEKVADDTAAQPDQNQEPPANVADAQANDSAADEGEKVADNEVGDAEATADNSPPAQPENGAAETGAAETAELKPPFSALPNAVDIPNIVRNEAIPEPVKLGDVITGDNFLLGLELITGESISKQNLRFELERNDDDEGQGWKVKLSPRNNDELTTVGRIYRRGDELWFTWNEEAKANESVNFFRNCILKLNTRNETRRLAMRKPIPNQPLHLTTKKPSIKSTLDLDWLPKEEAIVIQLLELPVEEVPNQFYEPDGRILSKQFSEGVLCFNFDPEYRFAWIKFDSTVGSKIRLEATMQMFSDERKIVPFKEYTFKKLGEALANRQSLMKLQFERLNAYQPVDGEKNNHRDAVKQASAELERMNKMVNEFNAFAEVVPKLFDRQLVYRVYFNLEGTEVELVSPKLPVAEPTDN